MKIYRNNQCFSGWNIRALIYIIYHKGLKILSISLITFSILNSCNACDLIYPPDDNKTEELMFLAAAWLLTQPTPDAPQNVVVLADEDSFRISWEAVSGATGYNIYWTDTGDATMSDTKIADVTDPYIHGTFASSTTHSYIVTAKIGSKESAPSSAVSATTSVILSGSLARLVATDPQANDNFGYSVDMSDDYLVVGAPNEDGASSATDADRGAVYVYKRTGSSTYGSGVKLTPTGSADSDIFGTSVSISGDFIIVGAVETGAIGSQIGKAYVFRRTAVNSWTQEAKLLASDPLAGDQFGNSVSISGNYAIVGAFGKNSGEGAVYFFHRDSSGTWSSGVKKTSGSSSSYKFGRSVAIDGDYAVVGEYQDPGSGSEQGTAYVYHRTGTNTWDSGVELTYGSKADYDWFGHSVSISGDYAIVGAPGNVTGTNSNGYAVVYHRTATTTWDGGTRIDPGGGGADDQIGFSVDIYGDRLLIGAPGVDGSTTDEGEAYMYTLNVTWVLDQSLSASDPESGDQFGFAVGVSSYGGAICAPYEDGGLGDPKPNSGTCYY